MPAATRISTDELFPTYEFDLWGTVFTARSLTKSTEQGIEDARASLESLDDDIDPDSDEFADALLDRLLSLADATLAPRMVEIDASDPVTADEPTDVPRRVEAEQKPSEYLRAEYDADRVGLNPIAEVVREISRVVTERPT